uniref:Uncharacterized protein n=1 Tax=Anguilla anguilla TaxID=7936 RepID=A0A0E9UUZ0_ANGAN
MCFFIILLSLRSNMRPGHSKLINTIRDIVPSCLIGNETQ